MQKEIYVEFDKLDDDQKELALEEYFNYNEETKKNAELFLRTENDKFRKGLETEFYGNLSYVNVHVDGCGSSLDIVLELEAETIMMECTLMEDYDKLDYLLNNLGSVFIETDTGQNKLTLTFKPFNFDLPAFLVLELDIGKKFWLPEIKVDNMDYFIDNRLLHELECSRLFWQLQKTLIDFACKFTVINDEMWNIVICAQCNSIFVDMNENYLIALNENGDVVGLKRKRESCLEDSNTPYRSC